MRKNGLLVFVFIMIVALFFAACDPRGHLSSDETEELYDEIKALFTTGEIFNYQAKNEREISVYNKPVKESDIEFIKSLAEQVFDESNQLYKYGLWWNSKRRCKICNIGCYLPMQYDGNDCIVIEFSFRKYKEGNIVVDIDYKLDASDDNSTKYLYVEFVPKQID